LYRLASFHHEPCDNSATSINGGNEKIWQGAEKVHQHYWKVKAEAKVEQTRTCSTLNLNLDLSLLHSLRPCWKALLSILRDVHPVIRDR